MREPTSRGLALGAALGPLVLLAALAIHGCEELAACFDCDSSFGLLEAASSPDTGDAGPSAPGDAGDASPD